MHWLTNAAVRAELKGATALKIPQGTSAADAWEITARALGTTPSDLAVRLAPTVRLQPADFGCADAKAMRLLPEKLARRFTIFPLREDDRTLVVATADPDSFEAEQTVSFASGRRVVYELAPPHQVLQAINVGYSGDRATDAVLSHLNAELTDAVRVIEDSKPDVVNAQEVDSAPIVRLTNLILLDAVTQRASDVHIEPGDGNGTVRFRIDGVIRIHMQLPMAALNRVVSRIKVLAKLDIADRLRPQDGRTRIQVESRVVDLRISTVPIRDAEKVVIRVLRPDSGGTLSDTGLDDHELSRLRQLLGVRDGIVLVTGPTGSGKTTTLYGALRELATGDVNIMTVEDPVEYELQRISQIQVETKRGVTFASALRAILRQDPDVIFVGEIRDLETADIAVQAAMTGHLVLATLHTNDAMSVVARLTDLGLQRPALTATLRGAVAQRLVRRLCDECAQPVKGEFNNDEVRLVRVMGAQPIMRAIGCARCANTGYYGRVPIVEVAVFSPQMLELVGQAAPTQVLQRAAVAGGMRTLREVALERVARSETTLAEIERVIGDGGGTQAPVAAADSRPTILIADDDPLQRALISAGLDKGGFRVAQAEDGAAALRRIQAGEECTLLVTDLDMPNMRGDALVKALRGDARTLALPIIVLTGSSDETREAELIDAGADDYIRKPVEPARLLARVKAALRRATG